MNIENWPIDRPKPYPKNARKIGSSAVDKVATSLREFGWRQPIVVDRDDVIICGHTRLLAAQKMGLHHVPVHVAENLTKAQVRAYRLMDNRSNQESAWDEDLLAGELFELKGLDFDLNLTGFNPGEIDTFLDALTNFGLTDEDDVPALTENPVTAAGDLWALGKHRLLCGDATDSAAVQRLMDGHAAELVFTDPPYNVDYEGYTEDRLTIQGDRMSSQQFGDFLRRTFGSYRAVVKPAASIYVCHPSLWQVKFQSAIESSGFEVRCQIIWAKNTFAWGFGRYKFQHEPIFYCHVKGQSDQWYGDKSQSTLWAEKKPAANRLHPTTKPVELIERALHNSSKAGDLVVDLFGGSGSTLIACERRDRRANIMELDPKYVDVIVTRWQEYTGKAAHLDGDARSFAEVSMERLKAS